MTARLLTGDCTEVLRTIDADSIDACVTDPPYGLSFMGKAWDYDVPNAATWREVYRVLKPGTYLLAFFGPRTYHRGVVQIEDAGFEIRDQIMWVYGSGFPKSHNIGNGWGTALKPAHEPIVVARKPLIGTVAENVARYGTGAINIDDCRIHADDAKGYAYTVKRAAPGATQNATGKTKFEDGTTYEGHTKDGRWPANLIHDGSDEVVACFPEAPGQIADASTSTRKNQNVYGEMRRGNGREGEASADDPNQGAVGFKMRPGARRGDLGSAARFFYCAKASKQDRDEGLEALDEKQFVFWQTNNGTSGTPSSLSHGRQTFYRNTHPTVKPTKLMRYLVRLVTPKGGIVLDPFMGSGSTGKAAALEGMNFIGIERDPQWIPVARARIHGDAPLFAEVTSAIYPPEAE